MLGKTFAFLAGTLVAMASATVRAEEKAPNGVLTLKEHVIYGRVARPVAALEVSRIAPHPELSLPRESLIDRIEGSVQQEPF